MTDEEFEKIKACALKTVKVDIHAGLKNEGFKPKVSGDGFEVEARTDAQRAAVEKAASDSNQKFKNPVASVEDGEGAVKRVIANVPDKLVGAYKAKLDNGEKSEEAINREIKEAAKDDIAKASAGVSLNEKSHQYSYKGKPILDSVTDLLNGFNPKKADWAATKEAKEAAERGTELHRFAQRYLKGDKAEAKSESEKAVARFFDNLPPHLIPIADEVKLRHAQYDFAGTIDLLLYDTNADGYVIIDFKTNQNIHNNYSGKHFGAPFDEMPDTPFNRYQLQLSAYQMLMEANGFKVVDRQVIHIKNTGNYSVMPTRFLSDRIKEYLDLQELLRKRAYRPLEDAASYMSLLEYKRNQQKALIKRIRRLEKEITRLIKEGGNEPLKNPELAKRLEEKRDAKKVYDRELIKTKNEIIKISNHKETHKYTVIQKDLSDIKTAIASGGIHDAYLAQNKLTFYDEFLENAAPEPLIRHTEKDKKSEEYQEVEAMNKVIEAGNEALAEIKREIPLLMKQLTAANKRKMIALMANDPDVQKTLENLNKSRAAREHFGKQEGEDFTTADLLEAVKDMGWYGKLLLGVQTSNTGDTALPQFLAHTFNQYLAGAYTEVASVIEELNRLNEEYKGLDKKVLHSKFKDGAPNGGLTDAFTDAWYEMKKEFRALASDFAGVSLEQDSREAYRRYETAIKWLRENAELIDFFKLPEVYDLYYTDASKTKYLNQYSAAERKAYQKQLKDKLGPQYEVIAEQLQDRLLAYEIYRKSSESTTSGIAFGNIWEFNDKYFKGAETAEDFEIPYEYIFKGETGEQAALFNKLGQLTFIPKSGEHYSEDFKKIKNSEGLSKFWSLYVEMSRYIDSQYGSDAQDKRRVRLPKVPNSVVDRFKKSGWNIPKGAAATLKWVISAALANPNSIINGKGLLSNNKDDSRARIRDKARMLAAQGVPMKEAIEKATKEVLATYYGDVEDAYRILLAASAAQKSREEIEPMAEILLNVYESVAGTEMVGNKPVRPERTNSIARMRYFMDAVIRNNPNAGEYDRDKGLSRTMLGKALAKAALFLINLPGKAISFVTGGKYGYHYEEDGVKFTLRQYSEQEKDALDELRKLKIYAGEKETVNIEDTVAGVKYHIESRVSPITDELEYWTNVNFYPHSNTVARNISGEIWTGKSRVVSKKQFEAARDAYFIEKANSYGTDVTWRSFINLGPLYLAFRALVLAPKAGLFNRMEGIMSNMVTDATGEYWEPGSDIYSKEALAFANLSNFSETTLRLALARTPFLLRKMLRRHKKIMEIKAVFNELGSIEERSRTNEMNQAKGTTISLQKMLDWPAILAPEFKNKGQVALNVMQSTYILDDDGKPHKFYNGKTKTFSAFRMNESGKLVLRDNFQKFRWDSQAVTSMASRIIQTINRIQGNYSDHDIMMAKKHFLGRAFMLFYTWLPEHLQQLYGIPSRNKGEVIVDLANHQEKRQGTTITALRRSKASFAIYHLSVMVGIPYGGANWLIRALQMTGFGFVVGSAVTGLLAPILITGLTATAVVLAAKAFASTNSVRKNGESLLLLGVFLEETLKGIWNSQVKFSSSVLGGAASKLTIDKRLFREKEKEAINANYLTEEEIGALKAMGVSLSVGCLMLLWQIGIMSLFYSWRDDEESKRRKWYNLLSNNATRMYITLNSKNWPIGLLNEQLMVQTLQFAEGIRIGLFQMFGADIKQTAKVNMNPLPRILREDDYFTGDPFNIAEKTGTFKYLYDIHKQNAGGVTLDEKDAKKEVDEIKKELKTEAKEDYLDVTGNGAIIDKILENYIKEKFYPLEFFGESIKGNKAENRHVKMLEYYETFRKEFGDDFHVDELRNGLKLRDKLVINLLPFIKMQGADGIYNLRGERIPDEDARHYISEDDLREIYEIRFDEPMPNLDLKKVFKENPPEATYEPEVKINEPTEIIK